MEKIRGLYKITNAYSGLFYIGKSVDIYKRSPKIIYIHK